MHKQLTIRILHMQTMINTAHLTGKEFRMARKAKHEWTKENVRELKQHSRAKTPVANISKLTKRTVGALHQKTLRLGMSLGHQR